MDQLRWMLLAGGAVLIALIYLWGMRARIRDGLRRRSQRVQPSIGGDEEGGDPFAHQRLVDVEVRRIDRSASTGVAEAGDEDQVMNLALTVIARDGAMLQGAGIAEAVRGFGLKLNPESGFFDCVVAEADPERPVFSMANVLKPGRFDPERLGETSTPGVVLFAHLPGPADSLAVVDLLFAVADQLAKRLGGKVCDARRHPMTAPAMTHLRNKVAEFERNRQLAAAQ